MFGGEINVPRDARRQIYRANAVIQGEKTEDYFRMNIAIPFIDHLQQKIITHFDAENRIGKDTFILVPAVIIKETNSNDLACRYAITIIRIKTLEEVLERA